MMISVLPVTDPMNVAVPPAVIVKLIWPFAIAYEPETTEYCVVVELPSAQVNTR